MAARRSTEANSHDLTHEYRARKPWKYVGYRDFCAFVTSDDDFFVLRTFSGLSARVLLALQDELSELEGQLEVHEKDIMAQSAPDVHNGSFRSESSEIRLDLIREIDQKLRAYNELAIQHSELRNRPPVAGKDRNNIVNWFSNHETAIAAEETEYIQHSEDLFAIVPKSKAPLRRFMEHSRHFRLFRLWMKASPVEDENVHYTSDQRIDLFVNLVIALVGLIMLIVPLWVLAFITWVVHRLAIITSFVVVFLCFVSFTTVARPFETLGAAAA
jgi:uncharacterized protein (DUF983 family)